MEIPQPNPRAVRESLLCNAYFKFTGPDNALVHWFSQQQTSQDAPASSESSPVIPLISPEHSEVGDEVASAATMSRRMERVTALLANDGQGAEISTPADVRQHALGHAANVLAGVQLLEETFGDATGAVAGHTTFNDVNAAFTAQALHMGSESIDSTIDSTDTDARLRLQSDVLEAAQLVANTYALAAMQEIVQ